MRRTPPLLLLFLGACSMGDEASTIVDSEPVCYLAGSYTGAAPDDAWNDMSEDFRAALSSTPGSFQSMVYYGEGRLAFALNADCDAARIFLDALMADLKRRSDSEQTRSAIDQLNSSWSRVTQESYERGRD